MAGANIRAWIGVRRIGDLAAEQEGARRIARAEHLAPPRHVRPRAADRVEAAHRNEGEGIAGGPVLRREVAEAEIGRLEPERRGELRRIADRADAAPAASEWRSWRGRRSPPRLHLAGDRPDLLLQHDLARAVAAVEMRRAAPRCRPSDGRRTAIRAPA